MMKLPVRLTLARALAGVSGVLLLAVSTFHATGTRAVVDQLEPTSVAPFFKQGLPVIWLFFSWHLGAVAVVLFLVAIMRLAAARSIFSFLALLIIGDFGWVYSVAGWFPGTIGLLLAAVATAGATALWPAHAAAVPQTTTSGENA